MGKRRNAQSEAGKKRYKVNCSKRGKQKVGDNDRQMEVEGNKNKADILRVATS